MKTRRYPALFCLFCMTIALLLPAGCGRAGQTPARTSEWGETDYAARHTLLEYAEALRFPTVCDGKIYLPRNGRAGRPSMSTTPKAE